MIIRLFLIISFITISIVSTLYAKPKTYKKRKDSETHLYFPINAQNLMDDFCKSANGFDICQEERKHIDNAGGSATYGEITYEGLATLLKDLKLNSKDVFYDLGCGVGKVCIQVILTTPAKAIGIELSSTRVQKAELIRQDMIKKETLTNKNRLRFIKGNIADEALKDATVIFMCSTCFPDKLMKQLTEKMAKLKKGLRVLTLKELTPNSKFTLIRTYEIPMTWSSQSPVYWYVLK